MKDNLIAQVIGRIPNLTDAQVSAMNSVQISGEAHIEADAVVGPDVTAVMSQVHESVDAGVYAVARLAVSGILSEGLIAPESSATLLRYWTDIVEPLDERTAEPYTTIVMGDQGQGGEPVEVTLPTHDTLHTPTEEELADLGAPVEEIAEPVIEAPAEEVGTPALVDAPLDIQEGEIQV